MQFPIDFFMEMSGVTSKSITLMKTYKLKLACYDKAE